MISIDQIIKKVKAYLPSLNEKRVREAFLFADKCHRGQTRASGEDYIFHPLSITNNLLVYQPDEDTIISALLHDVTEDCDIEVSEIEERFGPTVAKLVDGLEKLSHVQSQGKERQVGSLRKMFLAMAKDIRVVVIKLADRLHNMQTLHFLSKDKQKRVAQETLLIYVPIAARLGIYDIKSPLEDLSFFYLYPEEYSHVAQQMKKHEPRRTRILKNAKIEINKILNESGVHGEIQGRVKHYYSIYKKMKRKDIKNIDELYDIFALRIVLPTIEDCYKILGHIHQNWTPLAKRFKDYIAVPKPNGYKSLHTTVIGLSGLKTRSVPIEIQIRTEEMQQEAEFGIAAHWSYKENDDKNNKNVWIQHLAEVENKVKNNKQFLHNIEIDTLSDRIYVLTPNGNIKDLPKEATPVDFAFSIHTDVGLQTRAARVNGNIVPLDYMLEDGEVVEIVTSRNSRPHQNWLSFVKTTTAKNRIRNYLKSQDKDKIMREGRDALNKQLERFKLGILNPHLQILKEFNGKKRTMREREEIVERVGNGSLSAVAVVRGLMKDRVQAGDAPVKKIYKTKIISEKKGESGEILISGEKKIPVRIANCCNPKEGEKIIGFTTRGGHISAHGINCPTLKGLDPSRFIEAKWASDESSEVIFSIHIDKDRVGLLRDIVDVFAKHNVNISRFGYGEKTSPISADLSISASVKDLNLVSHVMDKLEEVEGVKKVFYK